MSHNGVSSNLIPSAPASQRKHQMQRRATLEVVFRRGLVVCPVHSDPPFRISRLALKAYLAASFSANGKRQT